MRAAAVLLLPMVLGAQRAPRWTLLPEVRIGGIEKGDAYDLPRVAAVVPGPNGSIYVVEPTTQTIRVFDAGGTHVRTIGRRGAGPGEFNVIGGLGFIADTLWTFDLQLRRVSLFSADGTFIQTVPPELSTPVVGGADVMFVSVLAVLPNGQALGRGSYPLAAVASRRVNTTALLLMTRGGRTLDTIARLPIRNSALAFTSGERQSFSTQHFSDSPFSVVAPTVGRAYVIDRAVASRGSGAAYRVTALNVKGDTLWNRAYTYAPKPLAAASVDSFLTRSEESFAKMGAAVSRSQIRSQLFAPEFRTPVASGFAGTDGSLWLKREDGTATVDYDIIAPTGVLVGSLTVTRNVTLHAATATHVWGVEPDADDLPHVVRYRINK